MRRAKMFLTAFLIGVLCWTPVMQPFAAYAQIALADSPASGSSDDSAESQQGGEVLPDAGDFEGEVEQGLALEPGQGAVEQPDAEGVDAESDDALQSTQDDTATSEVDDAADEAAVDNTANGFLENSWRYENGVLRADLEPSDRSLYSRDVRPEGATAWGIDVSNHQGSIDWAKVKAAGVDYAILRCGFGEGIMDDSFIRNVQGCKKYGIPFGVYLYCYAWDAKSAREEAEGTLSILSRAGVKPSDLAFPVYYDIENTVGNKNHPDYGKPAGVDGNNQYHVIRNNATFTAMAETYCNIIQNAGYEPGVYASLNWWRNYLNDAKFNFWDRWVAQYYSECTYEGTYSMWQYSSEGRVDGIRGNVDVNWHYGTRHILKPSNVQASPSGDGRVTISWDAVPGAERYAVAEKVGTSYRTFTLDARGTSYTADDLANGVEHRFLVQAYKRGRWSSFSDSDLVAATPTGTVKPAGVAAEPSDAAVTLSWRAVPGAERYAVASRNADGSYTTYTYDCRSTSFTVRGLLNGRPYEFLVQSYAGGRWSAFDGSDLARCVPDDGISPKVSASAAGDGELLLEWSAVPNATAYAIAEYKNGRFYTFTTECKATSFLASNLSNGRSHSFLVQAYVDGRWSSSSLGLLCFGTPTGTMKPSVVARPGYQSAKLSWNKVPGAARYAVALRLSNGSYRTLTYDCRSTSYVVEDLPGSTTHIFIVQAECDGVWSQFDSSDFVTVTPSGPTALEYLGYQNPSHLFQVSHNSVRIPHQGEGIFG